MHRKKLLESLALGLFSLVMLSLLSLTTQAQSFYGAISGNVTDSTGAIVPGATVVAINIGTNEKHTATANSAGEYRIVDLLPAVYKIEVDAKTFKRFVQDAVTVQVDNTTRVDAALAVGSATETIEVTTAPPLLETDSGAIGSEVEGKVVQEMPLNGRNVMNLLALVPGVVPQQNTSGAAANNASIHTYVNGWGNYSIGGGIANESANYIDGAGNNMLGGNSPALVLTQDMVQEFKVESGGVSAEYGHFGGGVVNMTTKSGSNAFHGSLYEFVRNTVLDANDIVSNNVANPTRGAWHQNQYGVVGGGPIKRDKAFFEGSWEAYSLHKATGNQLTVPTQAMRGDVTGEGGAIVNHTPIVDNSGKCTGIVNNYQGVTGQAFIPASCFDSATNVLKTFYAYPNIPTTAQGYNFFDQPLTGDDNWQYNARVDYNLSSKQRIFGRYTKWHLQDIGENDFKGRPGNAIASDYGATANNTNNIVVGDSYAFNPTTIGDIHASWMRDYFWNYGSAQGKFDDTSLGGAYAGTAGTVNLGNQLTYKEEPNFIVPGPDGLGGPWNIPVGANQIDTFQAFSLNESLTKFIGKHTFKLGGETMLRLHSGIGNYAWDAGQGIFPNVMTADWSGGPPNGGDEWASFMLGEFVQDVIHTDENSFSVDWSHGAYAIDTWRATSRLTLNLGLRWDYPGGIYEKKDRASVFLPNTVDPTSAYTGVLGTLALTNSPLYPSRDMSPVKWDLFAPRFSFAYSLNSTTVIRGGAGLSYIPPDMPIGLMAFNSPVNGANTTCTNAPPHPTSYFSNAFGCVNGTIIQPLGRTNPDPGPVFYNQVISSPVPTTKYPYMEQWGLTLSKQWKGNVLTEVSYAGSKGTKLPSSGVSTGTGGSFTSIDELPSQYFSMGYAALAATAPCAALGGATVSVGTCLTPFPQYGGVYDTGNNTGSQSYNAIYLILSKRFASGGVINANYTYSKTEGDTDQPGFGGGGSFQNFNNPHAEKSIASFDVPNRLIVSYVLDLPFGKGQRWVNGGGVGNAVLGGWQLNGITTEQSGFPYSFTWNSPNSNLFVSPGNPPANEWGAGIARPDFVPGCNLKTSGSYLSKYKAPGGNFFNQNCVVEPGTSYTNSDYNAGMTQNDKQEMLFGDAPRNTAAVRSQFLDSFDFTLQKSTTIWEKTSLLFRVEFFNIFNHPVFANAGSELGAGSAFNEPGQTSTVNNPRELQLSLRLNF